MQLESKNSLQKTNIQECTLQSKTIVKRRSNSIDLEIVLERKYAISIYSKYDLDILEKQLENNRFNILQDQGAWIEIQTEDGQKFILIQQNLKEWVSVGEFDDILQIVTKYPPEKFQLGAKCINGKYCIIPLRIVTWDFGIRVYFTQMTPHGDDANNFHLGTSMYTKDTKDYETSKSQKFVHQYVNSDFKRCCGIFYDSNYHTPDGVYIRRL